MDQEFSNTWIGDSFEYVAKDGFNLGRMSGYYVPPYTGKYTFYMFGSCVKEFFMSYNENDPNDELTSMNPENKVM